VTQERVATRRERPYNWRKVEKPQQRRSRARIAIVVGAALLVIVAGMLLYGVYEIHTPQGSSATTVSFVVQPGDTDTSVADRLQSRGLLSSALLFRIDARLQGLSSVLIPGIYPMRRNMSIDDMVKVLATYKPKEFSITIPPGWRAAEIAARLKAYGLNGGEFMRTVRHPDFGLGFRVHFPRHHTLNGFLFPDTYPADHSTTGRAFARMMVRRFAQEFGRPLREAARREHRSVYHIVTMASIVEREDFVVSQKALIASVYYNRLHNPALFPYLQSDPTVQYALGTPANWWPVIHVSPSSVHSRYNTYLHRGYPPGPICNPDLTSLEAAVHPAHSPDFYFFGKKNGVLLFEKTLQQHNLDAAKYG
jgi:UPF0755 protein